MFSLLSFPPDWKHYLPFRTAPSREVHDTWRLVDGTTVTLRGARADDGELIQEFVRGLSVKSRYQRFFSPIHELTPRMLERFTHNVPGEAMTLLAVIRQDSRETAIAMAQYVADPFPARCDFGVVVADAWQHGGLGRKLIQALICIARAAGFERIEGDVLAENRAIQRLMLDLGFMLRQHPEGPNLTKVSMRLAVPEWKCSPLTALAAQPGHGGRAGSYA